MSCAPFMINAKERRNLIKKNNCTHYNYYRPNVSLSDWNSIKKRQSTCINSQNASLSEHVGTGFVVLICINFWRSKTIKNSINCDDAPFASSLAFILVETKKLFKARNEIYCSDAPIEKKGNILKLLFDCGASRFSYCGCYHKSIN